MLRRTTALFLGRVLDLVSGVVRVLPHLFDAAPPCVGDLFCFCPFRLEKRMDARCNHDWIFRRTASVRPLGQNKWRVVKCFRCRKCHEFRLQTREFVPFWAS